jgi:hypothetical protein
MRIFSLIFRHRARREQREGLPLLSASEQDGDAI